MTRYVTPRRERLWSVAWHDNVTDTDHEATIRAADSYEAALRAGALDHGIYIRVRPEDA